LGSTRGSGRCRLSDRKGDLPGGRRRAEERAVGLPVRGPVLTSPFLEAQGTENGDPSLARAREEVEELIQQAQQMDPTLHVSLYARDLDDGAWIGIDERERYPPASLSKVAILVYTLHREESDPGFLEQEVVFPGPGTGLERMLYSLSAEQSFQDGTLSVDARTVAGLLRVLYNSSFLSRQDPEFALELLTESYFADGLRRLLPTDVVVASKFGFHGSEVAGRLHHELHECGIIYRPRSPYVICVMTRTDRSKAS
jgi:beta-lactamase class A